jgi:hypothetical protein
MKLFRLVVDVFMFALPVFGDKVFCACVLGAYATLHFKYPCVVRWPQMLDEVDGFGNRHVW